VVECVAANADDDHRQETRKKSHSVRSFFPPSRQALCSDSLEEDFLPDPENFCAVNVEEYVYLWLMQIFAL
jgi:hypothetical protein